MNGLEFFWKYAYPCSLELLRRGEIDNETFKRLEAGPDEYLLKKVFWRAMKPLRKIAERMNLKPFDIDVQKRYWYEEHNLLLKKKYRGFEHVVGEQLELCRIYPAKIVKVGKIGLVEYQNGERKVDLRFVENPEIGDLVTIHYQFACEKIDKKTAELILKNL